MKIDDYRNTRNELLNEAERLLDEGKVQESNLKQDEIKELDNKFDEYAKAQANLNALNNKVNSAGIPGKSNCTYVDKIGDISDINDIYASKDYRLAFMNHVVKGSSIPQKFINADENTKTGDIGAVIPTTVMERIIEKMESTGMIIPLVTRTSYKGGLSIPTSNVKPVATWVAEGEGSGKQKKTVLKDGMITFAYHKLRCAVSVTLEVETMALNVFETNLINNVSEAMLKALEQSIISGSGTGQPKGILTETAPTGQNIDIAKTGNLTYQTLTQAEGCLPLAYETGAVWFMTKKTFMEFMGMVDSNGQPIARVNYGIDGRQERTLLGRSVICNDYMSSYASTVTANTVFAFLFNPKDYILNTNLNITMKKYEDNETDDIITKAITLVDGKVIDKNSLVTLTKKSA